MNTSCSAKYCIDFCNDLLKNENELSLAYLNSSFPEIYSLNKSSMPKFKGKLFRLLIFYLRNFKHLLLSFKFLTTNKDYISNTDVLIFAGTSNQYNALKSSAFHLRENFKTLLVFNDLVVNIIDYNGLSTKVEFTPDIRILSFWLLIKNIKRLCLQLNEIDPRLICWKLDVFLEVYPWLIYSLKFLTAVKPNYLLVSNDHSLSNRCFIAVAHNLKIKTVYMQHASVSSDFPKLRFDYVFLDGKVALDKYEECEKNNFKYSGNGPTPIIFLSGQKKNLDYNISNNIKHHLAISINSLDSIHEVIKFCQDLVKKNIYLIVRWHPFHSYKDVELLKDKLSGYGNKLLFSDPSKQDLCKYFSQASVMVSANSSIHLEAACAGLSTIYYEFSQSAFKDYYGYVKNEISIQAFSIDEVINLYKKFLSKKNICLKRLSAIKAYSQSFSTKWENREGELVAKTLLALKVNSCFTNEYTQIANSIFPTVYKIK